MVCSVSLYRVKEGRYSDVTVGMAGELSIFHIVEIFQYFLSIADPQVGNQALFASSMPSVPIYWGADRSDRCMPK